MLEPSYAGWNTRPVRGPRPLLSDHTVVCLTPRRALRNDGHNDGRTEELRLNRPQAVTGGVWPQSGKEPNGSGPEATHARSLFVPGHMWERHRLEGLRRCFWSGPRRSNVTLFPGAQSSYLTIYLRDIASWEWSTDRHCQRRPAPVNGAGRRCPGFGYPAPIPRISPCPVRIERSRSSATCPASRGHAARDGEDQ